MFESDVLACGYFPKSKGLNLASKLSILDLRVILEFDLGASFIFGGSPDMPVVKGGGGGENR